MAVTDVYNVKNEKVGELELNESLFGVGVNPHILHDVVRMQLANRRAGTASTKTRAEVRGSGAKPWRQKGTGRARAGIRQSPLWRGGGTTFGPKPRDYSYRLPRKVRQLGLKMALSSRMGDKLLVVMDDFQMEEVKTKRFLEVMTAFNIQNALIVTPEHNVSLDKSLRNVPGFKMVPVAGLNVYDILLHQHIVILQPCIAQLEQRLLS